MNKLRSIIIILCILIVAMTIILLYIKSNINRQGNITIEEQSEIKEEFKQENKILRLTNYSDYLKIKDCINKYINLCNLNKEPNGEKSNITNSMLTVIPDFVKKDLNIDGNPYWNNDVSNKYIRINSILVSRQTVNLQPYEEITNISAYIVKGILIDKLSNDKKQNFIMIVLKDEINETFYIIPQEYIEENNLDLQIGKNLLLYTKDEIPNNTYNTYEAKSYSTKDMAMEYIDLFRENMEYDPQYIYDSLEEKYKEKRFGSYSEFQKYMEKKSENIVTAQLSKYKVTVKDNYTEYTLVDQNDNYYIINEIYPGEYTLILDTYTIVLPEYIEQYNKADEQQKCLNNINRFIKIVNDENYTLAYSMLADSYKSNYFKTQVEFENYAKRNLVGKDKIEFLEFKNEGGMYYTYKVELSNTQEENSKVEKTFVINLKEGTDFELSFNLN